MVGSTSSTILKGPKRKLGKSDGHLRVTYYQRHPIDGGFSIERIFRDIRQELAEDVNSVLCVSRFESRGFWRRLYNCIEAAFRQGDVNHITGDVHYLSYFLRKRRTIFTIHDCGYRHRLNGWREKIFYFLWYWLPEKRCCIISVISESTKREVLGVLRCAPGKVRVVQNCVSKDFQAFSRDFQTQKPNILQVGTGFNKNLIRVAQALRGVSCRLSIVGGLSENQKVTLEGCCIEYFAKSNISDRDLLEMYRQSDMLVFASTYEGFGLPILEANAIGRPVVTSNIPPMDEIGGDAVCLVNPLDIESIRAGILRVIEDEKYREKLITNGYKNAARFKPQSIAQQYLKLYEEILGKNK